MAAGSIKLVSLCLQFSSIALWIEPLESVLRELYDACSEIKASLCGDPHNWPTCLG